MTTRTALFFTAILSLSIGGCVRREGRNADCKWPGEVAVRSAGARHLSADAEFAEDLAIRYADTHYGLRSPGYVSGEVYGAARDRCMTSLFEQIAKQHAVPVPLVSGALGHNRTRVDLAITLPFLLLYCLAAMMVAAWLYRKYQPAEYGWIPAATMALFLSLAMAFGSTMLGEEWSGIVESWRIGNGHMSYRFQRLWWTTHRTGLFAGAVVIFWLIVAAVACRSRLDTSTPAGRAPEGGTRLSSAPR